jgi:MraZ protein
MATPGKSVYTGNHRHTLDDKNRLTIPSLWRAAHSETDTFLATPHPDGYIAVLPPAAVEDLHAKIAAMPLSDSDAQDAIASFFSETHSITFDKQGRISLTDELRRHAGIDRDAVLVGSMSKFNLYSPERWSRVKQKTDGENQRDTMRRLGI